MPERVTYPRTLTVRLTARVHDRCAAAAAEDGIAVSEWARVALARAAAVRLNEAAAGLEADGAVPVNHGAGVPS